ncbi:MAG TPA: PDZ domain-containing protein [Blastocatellia bacterium]|nr:PDZ domain-containing protein [Blastocatellia bacterium]
MPLCQGCGSELGGAERYCRNCGAPVATFVEDLVETHRFNPTNPDLNAPYAAPNNPTNPLFPGSPASHPAVSGAGALPAPSAGSLIGHLLQHKFAWVLIFLVVLLVVIGGVTVGRRRGRGPGGPQGVVEIRRSLDELVKKTLGFDPERVSDSDYAGIRGTFIDSLTSDDSPAALANMQAGDVLMELNNQPVRNSTELSQVLDAIKPGDEVTAKLYRDGQIVTTKIKLADPASVLDPPKVEARNQGFLGIEGTNRQRVAGTGSFGVEIRGVRGNGPADLAGLLSGDIVIEFDGHPIRTQQEFTRRIRASRPRSKVPVKFVRGGEPLTTDIVVGHVE